MTPPESSARSLAGRVYAATLRVLPRSTRQRYADEMVGMFEDEWADTRTHRKPAVFARAVFGLATTAVALRIGGQPGHGLPGSRSSATSTGRLRRWMADLALDARIGLRVLLKRPVSAAAVVLSLALGIGLNTAVFSLVNGLLLRPLPYAESGRLVQLSETAPGIESMDVSLPDFDYWRSRSQVFEGMFAFDDATFLLSNADGPEVLQGAVASPGFMGVLGIDPVIGRAFTVSEEESGSDRVVIISHALWDRRYARDPNALGQPLVLNGSAREIIGVAPPNFHFPEVAHVWVPLAFDPLTADPEDYGYDVIGRLGEGHDTDAALAEGDVIAAGLAAQFPSKQSIGTTAYPLRMADIPIAVGAMALGLLAAALLVMLVACTNVASLLLARSEDRRAEMSVRRALGASRGRLARQVLAESSILVGLGLSGALLLGFQAVELLPSLLPGERPFWIRFDLDGRVFGWSALMGVVCCLVISLPAARRAADGGRGGQRVLRGAARKAIIGTQVALSVTLVATAGLTARGLANLNAVDPGVDEDNVLVLSAPLPPWDYPSQAAVRSFYRDALDRVRSLPGVLSAAAIDAVPFLSTGQEVALEPDGAAADVPTVGLLSRFSDGYFSAMGIQVVAGQVPTAGQTWDGGQVAVVSESLAARMWPAESALGKRIRNGVAGSRSPTVEDTQPWLTVVAVVGDVLQAGPGKPGREALYLPMGNGAPSTFTVVVRTMEDPLSLVPPIQGRLREVDPTLAFYEPTTMAAARRFSIWTERTISTLLAGFGALAMVLSIVGIYGVIAHTTGRRQREMGLRMAIGASGSEVQGLVVGGALRLLLPGVGIGLIIATAVSIVFRAALYGVPAADPITMGATAAAFLLAGALAAYIPALRASKVDPAGTLRAD